MIITLLDGSTLEIIGCFSPGPRRSARIIGRDGGISHTINAGILRDSESNVIGQVRRVLL